MGLLRHIKKALFGAYDHENCDLFDDDDYAYVDDYDYCDRCGADCHDDDYCDDCDDYDDYD